MIDITVWSVRTRNSVLHYARARGATVAGVTEAEAVGNLMLRLAQMPNSGVAILTRSQEAVRKAGDQ